ncbi:MAG: Ferrous iron transport protein B [Alphaproteobacteria bacterium ADurb.Bin438]|nr:MAG: Ferrous iron transport protein B [Alphaproteobacteria bacterium ADurb.Bin438]
MGKLASFFDGKAGSFAYLLFILLYVPCLAAVATMFKEAGKNWAWFSVFWTNIQAYIIASSFYQIARFEVNPKFSIIFLSTAFLVELLIFLSLKLYKEKNS